jgi:hypothetical protein
MAAETQTVAPTRFAEKSYAIWLCPNCCRPLGVTDGLFLYVGSLTLASGVSVGCPCGDVKHFRRDDARRLLTPA